MTGNLCNNVICSTKLEIQPEPSFSEHWANTSARSPCPSVLAAGDTSIACFSHVGWNKLKNPTWQPDHRHRESSEGKDKNPHTVKYVPLVTRSRYPDQAFGAFMCYGLLLGQYQTNVRNQIMKMSKQITGL